MVASDKNSLRDIMDSRGSNSGFDALRLMLKRMRAPNSIIDKGPYLAEVLRVEHFTPGSSNNWLSEAKNNFVAKRQKEQKKSPNPLSKKRWLQIYARVTSDLIEGQPDIHSYLPRPKQLGSIADMKGDFTSDSAIRMHDVFGRGR